MKNFTLFILKTLVIVIVSMFALSHVLCNLQIQKFDKNGNLTEYYNIIECSQILK